MNLLLQAAQCDSRDWAASLLKEVLKIEGGETANSILPTADEWQRMSVNARLRQLGSWLQAECFEAMEAAYDRNSGSVSVGVRAEQSPADHHG